MRTKEEEKWNTITHSVALGIALTGLTLAPELAGKLLSAALVVTFLLSVLYHSSTEASEKAFFRMLDMASIHITIAVTGVAFCISAGSGWWPICLLPCFYSFVYTIKHFGTENLDKLMVPMCVLSGLISLVVLVAAEPSPGCLLWFLFGASAYLGGLIFYVYDDNEWYHTVWHLFVATAAFIHIRFLW